MPNVVTLTTETPDEVLNVGAYGAGAVFRLQWSATESGAFADVSGTGATPTVVIVTATRSYTAYDPGGTSSTWYRYRYESSGGTRLSAWTSAFQVGDEGAGQLCSVYDVEQELGSTLSANERENVLEKIRQVSVAIEGYTGRWFAPRPLSGTTTYRTHTSSGYRLRIPKGIRSITTLSIASSDQPATGGTYTLASGYYIDPPEIERDAGWPGTSVHFTTSSSRFYNSAYGVEIVGAFGWASVPYDIQGVAIRATVRRYIGKGGGGAAVAVGPEGTEILLPDLSGADRRLLEHYRHIPT